LAAEPKPEANQTALPTDYRPLELEKAVREFWQKNQIREKTTSS